MTESDYQLFKKEITGIESPGGILKSRLRVSYANSGTNLKHYMNKYFRSYYKGVDIDYSKSRVVFICDSEETRNQLAAILQAIRLDVGYDIPTPPTGTGDNPPPTGGGDNPPPTGGGAADEPKPAVQSKTTTYLIIAGVVALAIVLVIKFVK
jgi:hypothetical protein